MKPTLSDRLDALPWPQAVVLGGVIGAAAGGVALSFGGALGAVVAAVAAVALGWLVWETR